MKLLLVFIIILFSSICKGVDVPPRCQQLLQKYFVNNQNNGIQISYMDPTGKVVYARGNSMTAYLFSQDLANTDSYVALSSLNEDCFDGKTQPFSAKRTVEGFYDARSFRISKLGLVTIINEGTVRIFNITDCSTTVFNGYSDDGRLYAFHITPLIKYQAVALPCTNANNNGTNGNGNGDGDHNLCDIDSSIENTWLEDGIYYSYIVVKIKNTGKKEILQLTINGGTIKIKDSRSVWSMDFNDSTGDFSLPSGESIKPSSTYLFNFISIGKEKPNFRVLSVKLNN